MSASMYNHAVKSVRYTLIIFIINLFYYPADTQAETNETQELKLEVEALKKRILELQSSCSVKTSNIKASKNPWHSLQVNISKAEVKSLLGKPGKIDKWKTGEAWYFPDPRGGEVDFDANGNVIGWLEP
ncbi:MAG: hypothetical protein ACXV79_12270 [Methylobacter sp.]